MNKRQLWKQVKRRGKLHDVCQNRTVILIPIGNKKAPKIFVQKDKFGDVKNYIGNKLASKHVLPTTVEWIDRPLELETDIEHTTGGFRDVFKALSHAWGIGEAR